MTKRAQTLRTTGAPKFCATRSLADRGNLLGSSLIVLLPLAAGYLLSYIFRTINAVIADSLITEFSLDAAQLGLLTSAYFFAATVAQLPIGLALDRFGPRAVQTVCLLIAAAGTLMFSLAHDFATLCVARALIGLGVASALMAGLKAIVLWFPPERVPLLNGIFIAIGAAGAIAASAPAGWALSSMSWRAMFLCLSIAAMFVCALIFFLVPKQPEHTSQPGSANAVGLVQIACDRRFWRLAPLSALLIGTAWALQGLWAAP
jgi:MFS family permease